MSAPQSVSRRLLRAASVGLFAVALLGTGASCSRVQPGEELIEPAGPTQIVFINESLEQANVYAVVSGAESIRIGTVMPGRTETLDLPQQMVDRAGTVNIVARLLARTYTPQTGPVSIGRGERLQVRLPMDGRILSILPAQP